MSKIAFLVSGEKMFKKIKKYIDKKNIIVVEITISNALEEAKKLVDKGVKVILTKLAIKNEDRRWNRNSYFKYRK